MAVSRLYSAAIALRRRENGIIDAWDPIAGWTCAGVDQAAAEATLQYREEIAKRSPDQAR